MTLQSIIKLQTLNNLMAHASRLTVLAPQGYGVTVTVHSIMVALRTVTEIADR